MSVAIYRSRRHTSSAYRSDGAARARVGCASGAGGAEAWARRRDWRASLAGLKIGRPDVFGRRLSHTARSV